MAPPGQVSQNERETQEVSSGVAVASCRHNPLLGQVRPRVPGLGLCSAGPRPRLDPQCSVPGWPGLWVLGRTSRPLWITSGTQELNGVQCPWMSEVALPTNDEVLAVHAAPQNAHLPISQTPASEHLGSLFRRASSLLLGSD